MSRRQSVPSGGVSPYPLDADAAAGRDHHRHDLAEQAQAKLGEGAGPAAGDGGNWGLKVAAGSAIGSAAIAAAVLYWNRSKTR